MGPADEEADRQAAGKGNDNKKVKVPLRHGDFVLEVFHGESPNL